MKGFGEFIGESKMEKIIIGGLEVWPEDLGKMTWDKANTEVAKLGPDWRLPTIEEFKKTLYRNKENLYITVGDAYWSSTEHDGLYGARTFNFSTGRVSTSGKFDNSAKYVYAVRDFTGAVAIEYLLKDF